MALSSIDIDAARDVVRRLREFVEDAGREWREVGAAADEALCDPSALRGLFHPLMTLGELATQLEDRVELAVLIDAADSAALGSATGDGRVSFEVGDDEPIADVRSRITGLRLAADLTALEPGGEMLDRADVERMAGCAERLEAAADDPVAMAALFTALGPRGALQVPVTLRNFTEAYESQLGQKDERDMMWDETTHMSDRMRDLEGGMIAAYGTALAAASRSGELAASAPTFAAGLAAVATEAPATGHGWALSQILAHGTYGADFLADLGVGLVEGERDRGGEQFQDYGQGGVASWRLGSTQIGPDPVVAVLAAMDRTPGAALEFFAPATGDDGERSAAAAQARMEYLLGQRMWPDEMAALGASLRDAATRANTLQASVQEQQDSAWVASAMVQGFGVPGAQRIGAAAMDDVAAVVAHYIADVDDVANELDAAMSVGHRVREVLTSSWQGGLPVQAQLQSSTLNPVIVQLMGNEAAAGTLIASAGLLNGRRIDMSVRDWNAAGNEAEFLSGVNASAGLVGYLLGASEAAGTSEGTTSDQRNTTIVNRLFDAGKYALKISGPVTLLTDPLIDAAKTSTSEWVAGDKAAAQGAAKEMQERALQDLHIMVGLAAIEAGHLPEADRHQAGPDGQIGPLYRWFEPETDFDFDALHDESAQERVDFRNWLDRDTGSLPRFVDDTSNRFRDGVMQGGGTWEG